MIDDVLMRFRDGTLSLKEAKRLLRQEEASQLSYATIDYQRGERCGVDEIIFGLSKSSDQIVGIMEEMSANGIDKILVTRVDEAKSKRILNHFPDAQYKPVPHILVYDKDSRKSSYYGQVSVVTAGTSDLSVAEEAACVCEYLQHSVTRIYDVGVAGLHRLLNRISEIRESDVVIVVAGMEGALASVVGGLVDRPVLAVPTSIGYGANFQGLSALLSMLNSCSSGVGVMNIDNGFGAAILANSIIQLCREKSNETL